MGFPKRPNPADNDPDPTNPLADNLRIGRRRSTGSSQAADTDRTASIYDQQTVVDSNFTNRSQTRRLRQGAAGFSPQQLTAWAANPQNSRTLMIAAGVVIGLLLLFVLYRVLNNSYATAGADDATGIAASAAASVPPLGFEGDGAAPSTDTGVGVVPQPVETVPSTDPAAQQPGGGQFFVVTGTGTEGLFLRSEPRVDPATLIGTLPEGTRIEATGETQNDGTREWRKVRTDLGEGWVASDFLQAAP